MLVRSLCFFPSKSYTNPFSPTSISTNPRANSHNYQIISSNYGTLRFGFQKPSENSSPSVSFHTPNSTMEASDRAEVFRALEVSLGTTFSSQSIIPNPHPLIIVISGPSGVGKDAVIKRLMEVRQNLHFVVTATTRAKRPGEIDGKDYYFVAKDEFLRMIERNELLEYALVYGDYKGIPKQQIRDYMAKGCDIVLRVDTQGAATLRRVLDDCAVFVFLVAESEEALVKRLIGRKTETIEALMRRVNAAREELRHLKEFDYVVVNKDGELEESVKLLGSILDVEKAKVQQRRAVI